MPPLNVAIIGLGVGEAHIAGYEKHPECRVTHLCDFSESKLKEIARRYPGKTLGTRADDIFGDPRIDVVSVASYDQFHYEHTKRALEAGKHVFIEKPLCLYDKEARDLKALLDRNPRIKLSSNLILRHSPRFQKLKTMLQAGELGDLCCLEGDYLYGRKHKITEEWRGQSDFYSVVYGGGVHLVDLLLWLTGDSVVEVTAYGNQIATRGTPFRFRDCVVALLKFSSGVIAKLGVQFGCVFPHFHTLNVFGTRGTFINQFREGLVYRSGNLNDPPEILKEPYPGVHKGDLIPSFVDSILYGRAPAVTADEVFKTMAVCFAIEKSAQQAKPVRVEPLEGSPGRMG